MGKELFDPPGIVRSADAIAETALPTVKIGNRTFTILFPKLLRPQTNSERQALKNSIRKNGVIVALVVDEEDGIIDGGHRVQVAAEVGLKNVPTVVRRDLTCEQKVELALALNDARRHLSGPDRKKIKKEQSKLIAEALKTHPEKSNRQIGEEVGVDHVTVGRKREKLESTGEIHQLDKTTGKDGRTRTRKPRKPTHYNGDEEVQTAVEERERGAGEQYDKKVRKTQRETDSDKSEVPNTDDPFAGFKEPGVIRFNFWPVDVEGLLQSVMTVKDKRAREFYLQLAGQLTGNDSSIILGFMERVWDFSVEEKSEFLKKLEKKIGEE